MSQVIFGIASLFGAVVAVRVRREQKPNGGSTMRDAIDRIETRGAEVSRRLDGIEKTLADHGRQLERSEERIDHINDRNRP